MSGSVMFDGYEREYCELSTGIARRVQNVESLSGESRRTKAAEVASDVAEAEALIRRMDLEARSLPQDKKAPLLGKLRGYKQDLSRLKDDLKKASKAAGGGDAARAELGLGQDDWSGSSVAQRERLHQTTNRVTKTGERIKQ